MEGVALAAHSGGKYTWQVLKSRQKHLPPEPQPRPPEGLSYERVTNGIRRKTRWTRKTNVIIKTRCSKHNHSKSFESFE